MLNAPAILCQCAKPIFFEKIDASDFAVCLIQSCGMLLPERSIFVEQVAQRP